MGAEPEREPEPRTRAQVPMFAEPEAALAALLRLCRRSCLLLLFCTGRVQFMPSASANSNGNPLQESPLVYCLNSMLPASTATAMAMATATATTTATATLHFGWNRRELAVFSSLFQSWLGMLARWAGHVSWHSRVPWTKPNGWRKNSRSRTAHIYARVYMANKTTNVFRLKISVLKCVRLVKC